MYVLNIKKTKAFKFHACERNASKFVWTILSPFYSDSKERSNLWIVSLQIQLQIPLLVVGDDNAVCFKLLLVMIYKLKLTVIFSSGSAYFPLWVLDPQPINFVSDPRISREQHKSETRLRRSWCAWRLSLVLHWSHLVG